MESISSARPSLTTALITAVAPAAWGTTYLVTAEFLPPDRPLFAAAVRALPAGLLLLAWRRRLPTGSWWWRATLLGWLNIGLFFPLIFLAAYHLPGGLAATLQASSPLAVMALAFLLLRERPGTVRVLAALVGLGGVGLLVLRAPGEMSTAGLVGAFGSVLVSALGFVMVKRWPAPVDLVTLVSWQLVAGGLLLVPIALLVEGPPPAVDVPAAAGFVWLGAIGTALAYVCWFHGLTRMPAGAVSLVGLLNPVVGTTLGAVVVGEVFGTAQAVGMVLVLGGVLAGQPAVSGRLAAGLSAVLDRHRVREQLPRGVAHPPLDAAGAEGLDVGGEGLVGDVHVERELLPGAAALARLDVEDHALAARVDAGEVELPARGDLVRPCAE
ncbi:EamA family transporter [Nocardioides donggukensis]|uniref:EamA family transporter n=1 Tax=Nocardioides donggukensis TaxID=2774019 RepID=A0A927PZY1_9ACTN|nr:EamA family transporter [Nocardioides donggukensis]MBD8868217.1 EamA family transporter [Nocardioides donggukensis]